jgi:hypothetical protein
MYTSGNSAEFQREELIANVLTANTPEQCSEAEKAITQWMQKHPRDFGMLDVGEQLTRMSERYEMTAEESARLSFTSIAGENE